MFASRHVLFAPTTLRARTRCSLTPSASLPHSAWGWKRAWRRPALLGVTRGYVGVDGSVRRHYLTPHLPDSPFVIVPSRGSAERSTTYMKDRAKIVRLT